MGCDNKFEEGDVVVPYSTNTEGLYGVLYKPQVVEKVISGKEVLLGGCSVLFNTNFLLRPHIVCAANKLSDGTILAGARHWDSVMRGQATKMSLRTKDDIGVEQGFIDQWGNFYDRKLAMQVVKQNGQPFNIERNGGQDNELYSEGLY